MDEGVFQPRLNLFPLVTFRSVRRDGLLECARVRTAEVERGSEGDRLLHAGSSAKLVCERLQGRPRDRPGTQMRVSDHFADRTLDQQISVGDVGKMIATLRLIH